MSVQVFGSLLMELAFDEAVVLLFHSALRFMHLQLLLVMILTSPFPVDSVLSLFFYFWSSSSVSQRGACWICYSLQGFCSDASCLLSPLSEGAGVPSL
jgi:hypothetical protein